MGKCLGLYDVYTEVFLDKEVLYTQFIVYNAS